MGSRSRKSGRKGGSKGRVRQAAALAALSAGHRTLICYDIADPRRLGRVHRVIAKRAIQVQYSVYLFTGGDEELDDLLDQIQDIIAPARDDIRIYPVPRRLDLVMLGRRPIGAGIYLSGPGVVGFFDER